MTTEHMEELNDQQIVRREKMAALREQGIDPFGKRFERTADSGQLKEKYSEESFDKILLDAPCSGLGVMKRKPEIKYHDSGAMDTIIPLQAKLLDNAYYLLKKNGKMVYSTCTINKKENEQMIKQFLDKYPDMKIIEEKKILPYVYDSDGFYMCKLEKGK